MDKKSLYICKNLKELDEKADFKITNIPNLKGACNTLGKLYENFEKSTLDKDEELAYIYIMRFLTVISEVKKKFPTDKSYINAFYDGNKINDAFTKAENLKKSLRMRYETIDEKLVESKLDSVKVTNHIKEIITVDDLYKSLKRNENILIVDTRSEAEFNNCHISHKQIVNIPANKLKPGCTIVDVNKLLDTRKNDEEINIWKSRQSAAIVVLIFWNKGEETSVNIVKDAISKWDAEHLIKNVSILENGLQSFTRHYPTMVTNSKYKGPEEINHLDENSIDINYPNLENSEIEKKRKKPVKKSEPPENFIYENGKDNDLENRFNQIKSNNINAIVNRDLKPQIVKSDSKLKGSKPTSIVVDRSLKPRDQNLEESFVTEKSDRPVNNPTNVTESSENVNKNPTITLDRSLKPTPNVLRENNVDNIKLNVETNKDMDVDLPSLNNTASETTRLSNNSRTTQDRTNFTAKGGAKSIPPPTSAVESKQTDLPPYITKKLDKTTNKYIYVDRKTNQIYRDIADDLFESAKENSMQQDHVERLKDHSTLNRQVVKHSGGTSLKRSTSQPNLSDDLNSQNKIPNTSIDGVSLSPGSERKEPDVVDKPSKPSSFKQFIEVPASRLHNFNPSYKTVIPGLTGLRNMGNTCYLNSVVQALSNTKFLNEYILSNSYRLDVNKTNPLGSGGEIVEEFAWLITALWCGKYREVSPYDFKHMIDRRNEMFRGGEQHDSQEFLLFLLDGLHEDLNNGTKQSKVVTSSIDNQPSDKDRADEAWSAHISVNDSAIVRSFQGQYRSKVTCDSCQKSSVTFDTFMYLSLPLVPNQNRCSLQDCLKLFLAEEQMTGASQWFCPKCKTNRNARKKIDIWKLPPYLLIHLKRFSCTGQYRQKLNTFVDFPIDLFSLGDILRHADQKQTHQNYRLYAVSNHHGNMESGHYTSFCKNWKEKSWYNFDDDVVTKIRETDVRTPSAYILFYESHNIKSK